MTAGTIEVTRVEDLEELLGQEAPPCDVRRGTWPGTRTCGCPSAVRITVTCCGTTVKFLCQGCWEGLEAGWGRCTLCGNYLTQWVKI